MWNRAAIGASDAGAGVKLRFFPLPASSEAPAPYPGLELLATAVLLLRADRRIAYANPAAENLFELSRVKLVGHSTDDLFGDECGLAKAIDKAVMSGASYTEQELELGLAGKPKLHLTCTVSAVEGTEHVLALEFRHIDQQLKIAREERLLEQQLANRELIRSLAHEIKNPLGGIRGAAQLLERELDRAQLIEYTQVIIG
jgi:two-component system nitrogen regulation sensor histidine kinase GlnL